MVSDWIHCSTFILFNFLTFYNKCETPLVFVCVFFLIFRSHSKFFMAEEWVKNARGETRVVLDARAEVEVELGALKENHTKMAE